MTEASDVIFAETQAIIDTRHEEEMRMFRDVLTDAADKIDNALYELIVDGGILEGGGA